MVYSTFIIDTEHFISLFTFRFVKNVVLIVIKKILKLVTNRSSIGHIHLRAVFMNKTAPHKRK